MNNKLNLEIFKKAFEEYIVSKQFTNYIQIYHPLFQSNAFTAQIQQQQYIGHFILLTQQIFIDVYKQCQILIKFTQNNHFVPLKGIKLKEQQDQSIIVYIFFEYINMTINEINWNAVSNKFICKIISQILKALSYLQKQKSKHGNLNFYSILLKHDQIKIFYHPMQPTSIQLYSIQAEWSYLYLSPEQLQFINKKKQFNANLSDVFNLGCIFLNLLVREQEGFSNQSILNKKIGKIKQKFGVHISSFFKKMIRMEIDQRPTFYQLQLEISEIIDLIQNDYQITSENTQIDFGTQKIKEEVKYSSKKKRHRIFEENKQVIQQQKEQCIVHCLIKF